MSTENKNKKKGVRRNVRSASDASSPEPTGPTMPSSSCGHDGCGLACRVRYVGNTTHLRDHFVMHAARGASQVWTAAIVSGLAIVLTGAVAWSAMQSREDQRFAFAQRDTASRTDLQRLTSRLELLEKSLQQAQATCQQAVAKTAEIKPTVSTASVKKTRK